LVSESGLSSKKPLILLLVVLVIATAGIVYELAIAAVASYLLGDSVTQFSLIIGLYLSALGLGAWLSGYIEQRVELTFIDVEVGAALVGGLSAPALMLAFDYTNSFRWLLYFVVVVIGTLVGLELPLLLRILRRDFEFKDLIARALSFDYAGALLGSLGFSLLMMPRLGLVRSSVLCGFLNAGVALVSTFVLPDGASRSALRFARVRVFVALAILALAFVEGNRFTDALESSLHGGKILVQRATAYQRILITEQRGDLRLYLNNNLQFSSRDERRYHESLVHPVLAAAARTDDVLIMGGGDGLALREVLKWKSVRHVTLVDLDPGVTDLFRTHPALVKLNQGSLADPRVELVNADAMIWLGETRRSFDVELADFPDPTNYSLGKLYSRTFYSRLAAHLRPGAALGVQATSPLFARTAFWCIATTLESVGFSVLPYHAFVPSFGEWGFLLATRTPRERPSALPDIALEFLDSRTLALGFDLPEDIRRVHAEPNRLDNQALVGYYLAAWERFE
jgi:spermidine synthase